MRDDAGESLILLSGAPRRLQTKIPLTRDETARRNGNRHHVGGDSARNMALSGVRRRRVSQIITRQIIRSRPAGSTHSRFRLSHPTSIMDFLRMQIAAALPRNFPRTDK